jgi:hypothetical protein
MAKDITKLLWHHNSYFIKDKDWEKDFLRVLVGVFSVLILER